MTKYKFAVFILTHGRAGRVITVKTLRKHGYTGDIYIIIDNEDAQADAYYAEYGDKVIMFDKAKVAATFDEVGRSDDRRSITYARNAAFDIANDLGLDYFMQMDDDYDEFTYRFSPDHYFLNTSLKSYIRNLDGVFQVMLDYYDATPVATLAMGQSGDYIAGGAGAYAKSIRTHRKAMNSFLCSPHRRFTFIGRLNEDVNTYTTLGSRGELFLTCMNIYLSQGRTQSNPGGITELYKSTGTYAKAMTTVIQAPSCTTVKPMGLVNPRLHHSIKWRYAVPQIVADTYRKV